MDTQTQEVMFSSKSDEWATPQALFDKLNHTHNFTLDPCATAQTAKCSKYFTKEDDGLSQSWAGENVFINPPYSNVSDWVEKAYKESVENAATCVLLIPSRTDTKWFHRYCMQADVIQFIKGRVKFENGSGKPNSAPFPSMIVVFDGKSDHTSPQMTGYVI